MVREFKKIGVAAAVAGALLASGSSYATVQLSEPGDVVLVPYVICDPAASAGQVNTLVGLITFDKRRIGLEAPAGVYWPAPWSLASFTVGGLVPPTPGNASLPERRTTKPTAYNKTIHWYFYNTKSEHLLDGVIPATDNDFVRVDWCSAIQATGQTVLNGVPGYMIFTSDEVDRDIDSIPSFALYGHAYQIQGNWESQAFIPVLPNPIWSLDQNLKFRANNVVKRNGYPAFARLLSGTDFTHVNAEDPSDVTAGQRDVYMRYFLDPALATENRMVFWFNFNATRVAAGETYDSEQVYRSSFSVDLGNELTILRSTPTDPRFPGMLHEEEESYSGATVKNTGIVRLGVPEFVSATGGVNSNVPFLSSGVSFNMLGLGAGAAAAQLQTEMSTVGPAY
ncbi:MAG: hypothetical protein HGB05_07320 [Chloroflexi bacterium]|nr:hypothetical protein [Chloroflexota bacterium]